MSLYIRQTYDRLDTGTHTGFYIKSLRTYTQTANLLRVCLLHQPGHSEDGRALAAALPLEYTAGHWPPTPGTAEHQEEKHDFSGLTRQTIQ